MYFNIKKYCFCEFPIDATGEKTVEYLHEGINVFVVSSGRCIAHSQGKAVTVNTGEILYATGNLSIDIINDGHIIGINIDGIIPEKYCKEASGAYVTSGIFAPFLPQQIMQIVSNYNSLSESYLCNTAFEIVNTLSNSDKKAVVASQVVTDAVILIKENYSRVYGVEELAHNLNVSKSHLVREFCKYTGTTPGKYLTTVRVDAVKQLLVQENLSLNTIAALTGFSGDNYLCKAFKKVTGETPMSYRVKTLSSQYLPNQTTIQIQPEIYL